ncbi:MULTISPECIES: cell division protein FtsQ/DivIB [Moraxella]|uniref:FtsQ-type POTRA domain-containing protein n=1 Tax=Faucicola osloensis TaxID=34062 RepID=A0AAW6TBL7_FAUOS|nr:MULTISPECIES: cell division protein FtsQ/DivIB [Moraxella]MDI4510003.1 FtsQ-type POTRA domain-containing protein [Moraxella osloensis]
MANSFVATASLDTTLPNRFHQLLPKLLMLGVVLLLLILAALAINVFNKLPNAAISLQHKGLNTQQTLQLQQLLGEKADTNLLKADLQSYVAKLETVDWVGQADVRRDWQQGIVVNVVPRQAVAKFGSERLVDANGMVFKPADSNDLNNTSLMQLQGDSQNAIVMMQQIKQVSDWFMPLGIKIEEVIVTPRMAWLFRFDNGLRVLVDNDNTSEKLYRLSIMLQNQLKPQLKTLQTVDLRYKNGMAITKRPMIQQASDTTVVNAKSADTKPVTDANSTTDSKTEALKTPAYPSH